MSDLAATPLNSGAARGAPGPMPLRRAMLRRTVDEFVGVTFFGEMLKIARNSSLKGELGHGGWGEEVFGGQLDLELARRAGRGMRNRLSNAIYNRFAGRL